LDAVGALEPRLERQEARRPGAVQPRRCAAVAQFREPFKKTRLRSSAHALPRALKKFARSQVDARAPRRGSVRVSVENGIVTLEGAITDDRLHDGLRVLAENTPGVTKVRDRIARIEPNSGYLVPPADAPGV
jgi:BON domain